VKSRICTVAVWILGTVVGLSWSPPVSAYDVAEVTHGGTITGRVSLNGPLPGPRVFPIVLYPFGEFCKKISDGEGHILLKEFNIDDAGHLQDAVVAVQKVSAGKPFRFRDTELVTVNCMFHPADVPENEQFEYHGRKLIHVHPLVSVMRNHTELSVLNRDPVVHATQVYQKETGRRVLVFPVPVSRHAYGGYVDLAQGKTIVQMICAMHEFMQTWAWIVDNPYYSKTRKGGGYTIDQLPPGTYKVIAWHPHLKPIEKTVIVAPDSTVDLDFQFDARQVVRPVYESQEHFRIGPDRDPFLDLKGCEDPYCVKREHRHAQ
jgi:hypothetical protein